MKKGRHRRFEEARSLKRSIQLSPAQLFTPKSAKRCPECNAVSGATHASWCLADESLPQADSHTDLP
ncbi:MAG: hypothetical protein M1483_00825 [Actinobacteria bacterium]|nr:hypothetical protein [Actinomycetota bacterium]MCL6104178.1 hypothetical protein [Actinomycetota bacterium]